MPTIHVLIGLPGSGKSTWRAANCGGAVIISSDDEVEAFATANELTYSEAWHTVSHKEINRTLTDRFNTAVKEQRDIVVDMTNVGRKRRRSWLASLPSTYTKIAVDFQIDDAELSRRLDERAALTGKYIPKEVVKEMAERYDPPSRDEGFHRIIKVR